MNNKNQNKILDSYKNSLKLSALQLSALQSEINDKDILIARIKKSLSWKITLPVRILGYIVKGKFFKEYPLKIVRKRLLEIYREDGIEGIYNKFIFRFPITKNIVSKLSFEKNELKTKLESNAPITNKNHSDDKLNRIYQDQFTNDFSINKYSLILIIAEVTLPQCYKYRVQQKAEHLERLGWDVKIVDWREQKTTLSFLQICKEVIFYRVPAFPNVTEQINEAKRLGLSPWWEVDDLIVDRDRYAECGFMHHLTTEEKDLLFFGADLFRKTMLSCDRAIASTKTLADVMSQAGLRTVCVIENALDKDTLRIAQKLYPNSVQKKKTSEYSDEVVIVYGSGTNTHNADFLIASSGVLSALKHNSNLRLWIIGELELPVTFQECIHQIKYIPPQSYEQYLELLAQADIAIAPLEPILFNDAKSNIKYLEASILGIPSICSPRQAFKDIIRDQENGLLANTAEEWKEKILYLAENAKIRQTIGLQAYHDVVAYYSPDEITIRQVEPVFGYAQPVVNKNLKILVVNVYYAPYSFGGATFVAEEMARRIHETNNVEVTVFTTRPLQGDKRGLCRYQSENIIVYSIDLSPALHASQQFNNIETIESFEMVLTAERPDIVHFHSIQNMGLQMLLACQSKHIPYIITLHDSWWLCNRQFMVKSNGQYCFQKRIDLQVCQRCEPESQYLIERMMMMQQGMQAATLLLSPSETHRQLYIANDVDESLIKVNRNGIVRPKKIRPKRPKNTPLRFGFVAGDEVIKGAVIIKKAFKSLSRSDWELKIIDSKVDMGFPPIDVSNWNVKGKVMTVPPYDDAGKDDFFYGIDVLLFPSQWKESYGLTVREALLRDVWVICSHPGGQSEDVIDGTNGNYISLKGDVSELVNVIEEVLDKASMFDYYENPYKDQIATLEGQAEELLEYYRQIKEEMSQSTSVS
ncbi:glycosyltransferase [Commensalibacter communis]|uniref:glycosyltransferase n=1 Tax=Commensalibacter communis TaxID=2972786 RepID=UPI0022FFAC76|nr:glycosyltransferase [Commensalibacter communis]CAI3950842.1 Glycosyltransferase involved in cell wall bisynthesis (RfaB) (PDB:2IV7) [Commensalibacter communis]CAI3956335.1 Glycosyltransferase involved in cell wall bisynthesis (RfaB) (PDB:2IV7) [Commensalibacter communis]